MDLMRRRSEPGMSLPKAWPDGGFNWKKPKKILAVDDDQSITLVVQMSLQSEGYEVVTARNGREALEMVREHQPDMVVMDVMMPIMDGLSALRILKEDESTADIPVIMLTARTSEADVLSGWLRGADMYMTKPFDPWQLIANVNNIFFEDSKSDEEYFEKKQ
jgi:two-component system alkaline phosphatase synthesis response regulator PhoP/two-component system response regulator VicR